MKKNRPKSRKIRRKNRRVFYPELTRTTLICRFSCRIPDIPLRGTRGRPASHQPGGDITLHHGFHDNGRNTGAGVEHIWKKHRREIEQKRLVMEGRRLHTVGKQLDAPAYVAKIIVPGASIYLSEKSHNGYYRLSVVNPWGMVVLEYKEGRGKPYYSVVTAYPKNKHGSNPVETVR